MGWNGRNAENVAQPIVWLVRAVCSFGSDGVSEFQLSLLAQQHLTIRTSSKRHVRRYVQIAIADGYLRSEVRDGVIWYVIRPEILDDHSFIQWKDNLASARLRERTPWRRPKS
jgi:hypothetical protein